MSELLPIIFARGQNEGIDPRLAPPDVHVVAQNVRWRKDGRPAKRYGLTQITSTGLNGGGRTYTSNAVNAIGACNTTPTLVLGSGVRQFINGAWTNVGFALASEIPHWGPGRHDPIARADLSLFRNASVGYSSGVLFYAWDDGVLVYYSIRLPDCSIISPPQALTSGTFARCISTPNFIYLLYAPVGSTTLTCATFNPATLAFGATISVGTLNTTGAFYDAVGRTSDFVVVYQSAAAVLTVARLTAVASPVSSSSTTITMTAAQQAKMTVASTATSAVFVGWVEATSGKVEFAAVDNAVTAVAAGPANIDTAASNVDQPGIVIDTNTTAGIFWGGYTAAPAFSYLKTSDLDSSGTVTPGFTLPFVREASKPFLGLAPSDRYLWVHTHNSDTTNSGKAWDDQRTFYLMRTRRGGASANMSRQMHTPGMVGSTGAYTSHLAESVDTGSGFFVALVNTIRFGNAAVEGYGIDSVSFHSIFESQRYAARDIAQTGRALQISGGALYEFNGYTEETDFSNAPVIVSAVSSAGGGLTPSSSYFYVAVFEWIDDFGRRHRSAPSDPFPFSTTGANFTATVTIQSLISSSRQNTASLHIYRTTAGGTTYHRVSPNFGPPTAVAGVVSFVDAMSDANAAAQEFVYTDGGVSPNALCPPHTFMAVCNGRLWVGGQLDRNVITASKLLVDGEPTQFSALDQFSAFLPEDCTGLAGLDGTVVAFARESIYLINGDGPNDQGIGAFNPPQKLPTDTGCIDWRSVLETSLGVFYQSKRGFFLLPRGFNTPLFIGAEVEDTVSNFPICLSATLVSVPSSPGKLGEITARFVMSNAETTTSAVVLVYDLRVQGWSVDISPNNTPRLGPGGTWNDTFIQSKSLSGHFDSIFAESNSTFDDAGSFVSTEFQTGDIRPFGVAGYGGFERVVLLGEYRGDAIVNINVSVDGATPDFISFNVTGADPGASDGSVYLDVTPRVRMGSAIRLTVLDTSGTPSEGFIPQALFIEHETIGKTKRLAAARKA